MKLRISERRKKENNREYAYRVLRDNIMTMQLLPGETLNEAELAEIFHVSRTPVHEAVIMLKEEMLVEVYPQSGSKVSYININTLKEGYFMRSVLEPEILATLAGSLSQDYVEKIKENLDLQKKVLEENQISCGVKGDIPDTLEITVRESKEARYYLYQNFGTEAVQIPVPEKEASWLYGSGEEKLEVYGLAVAKITK